MGQAQQLPAPEKRDRAAVGAVTPLTSLEDMRCALCGSSLVGQRQRYHMVSPLVSMGAVTVCRTCRRAALSEGYRPAR
jgi:hypothetical protein